MGSRKTGTARVEPPDTTWGTARVWGPVPGRRVRRRLGAWVRRGLRCPRARRSPLARRVGRRLLRLLRLASFLRPRARSPSGWARRGVDARSLDSSCLSGLLEVAGAWGAGAGRGFGFGAGVGAGAGSGADGRLAPRSGVGAGCGGLM